MAHLTSILCKTWVFGIIVLFILTGLSPLNAVNTVSINYTIGKCPGNDIDWWPMFHHDLRRSGYSTSKAPDINHPLWNYNIGGALYTSPAVVDDRIYIETSYNLWNDNIYCLNATSGVKIWSSKAGTSSESSFAVVNGKLYIGSGDCNVYCIDADDGNILWRYETNGEIRSSPAVANGRIYIGSYTPLPLEAGRVYCLDADTGNFIWSFGSEEGNFYSSPAVVNGLVYVSSNRGTYCLNAITGAEIWNKGTEGEYSSPTVVNDMVYFGSDDGHFYCLNATTGTRVWSSTLEGGVKSSPAFADGKVYIGTRMEGYMYCFNAMNGTKIWSFKIPSDIYSSPAIADKKVFFSSRNGFCYCLNATTGTIVWNYTIGEKSYVSPAVANGKVYIGSHSDDYITGKIFAFGDSDPGTPSAPEIKGPITGSPRVLYDFKFTVLSPVGKDLYYWIEWGDGTNSGWLGPFESGVKITESHEWNTRGVFSIQAKVKDTDGLVSGWGRLDMNIPRTRASSYHWFLEKFPLLERLLNLFI